MAGDYGSVRDAASSILVLSKPSSCTPPATNTAQPSVGNGSVALRDVGVWVGARVRRRPCDWDWGDQDGGAGGLGTVACVDALDGWCTVVWDATGQANEYRCGHKGKYDVTVDRPQPLGLLRSKTPPPAPHRSPGIAAVRKAPVPVPMVSKASPMPSPAHSVPARGPPARALPDARVRRPGPRDAPSVAACRSPPAPVRPPPSAHARSRLRTPDASAWHRAPPGTPSPRRSSTERPPVDTHWGDVQSRESWRPGRVCVGGTAPSTAASCAGSAPTLGDVVAAVTQLQADLNSRLRSGSAPTLPPPASPPPAPPPPAAPPSPPTPPPPVRARTPRAVVRSTTLTMPPRTGPSNEPLFAPSLSVPRAGRLPAHRSPRDYRPKQRLQLQPSEQLDRLLSELRRDAAQASTPPHRGRESPPPPASTPLPLPLPTVVQGTPLYVSPCRTPPPPSPERPRLRQDACGWLPPPLQSWRPSSARVMSEPGSWQRPGLCSPVSSRHVMTHTTAPGGAESGASTPRGTLGSALSAPPSASFDGVREGLRSLRALLSSAPHDQPVAP
eukprot:TRINITY_DN3203_c0_g1_i1.p1 TRINITY_DN3203_c0_g1~~TRINITY_DN3203_c0_g1_i1.p1  ORF type:complete len:580 (+),score=163.33 TRINITY_DN3203_c0_g1_i1:75-1742(+)